MQLGFVAFLLMIIANDVYAQDVSGQGGAVRQGVVQSSEALPAIIEQQTMDSAPLVQAMNDVQNYMQTVGSLQADIKQYAPDGTVTKGKLSMQRPGRIRFDFGDDIPFLVVADGKTLAFIDYEIGQITRWPVADTPLRVLLGDGVDLASFGAQVQLMTGNSEDDDIISLAASDPKKPEMGSIIVYFRRTAGVGKQLSLTGWTVQDAQGSNTYIELANNLVNLALDEKLWSYKDPRGSARRRRVR